MKKHKVIGIGEILWDVLSNEKILGGAPANFAYHAQQLCANAEVWSAIGNDQFGNEILEELDKKGLPYHIVKTDFPTGTVDVQLENGIPSYMINDGVAWDNITLADYFLKRLSTIDAICFGTLCQRSIVSRQTIQYVLNNVPDTTLKIFDINLRKKFYNNSVILESLKFADVLKLNEEELVELSQILSITGDDISLCKKIFDIFNLTLLALTKGATGSYIFNSKEYSYMPTPKVQVVDSIGAGDSFTAAFVMAYLNGDDLKKTHQSAVNISSYVCTQKGATPCYG